MLNYKNILITGGAGFIGGNLVRTLLNKTESKLFNIDYLNYSSDLSFLNSIEYEKTRHHHININLNNSEDTFRAFELSDPDVVIHLAAESHVDRSIDNPVDFVNNNINGTLNLLEASRIHFNNLNEIRKQRFVFLNVSTDEVFGSLGSIGDFDEDSPYLPRSPYAASKASSDHMVNAWSHTYNLPIITTNCTNNYGPYQYPEKLIPLCIIKAIRGEGIPIYGDGLNIRDWLYVDDHIDAILNILFKGSVGSSYCIGGNNQRTNLDVVKNICILLDSFIPKKSSYTKLINFVEDRPGHDRRYSINSTKLRTEIGWVPKISFDDGLTKTIKWYLNNLDWCNNICSKTEYGGQRLGLLKNKDDSE